MSLESNSNLNPPPNSHSRTADTKKPLAAIVVTPILWLMFIANALYLVFNFSNTENWRWNDILQVNGFTILIWTTVSFFSAIVSSYAGKYLIGFRYHTRFMLLCLSFTLSVMLLVMSNNVWLLIGTWLLMGIFMSQLIGIDRSWGEAREALKFTQKYFLTGGLFLAAGVAIIALYTNKFTITEISSAINNVPVWILMISAICIIAAAIVQSAIYPFHRWLLSAMTAPTPASALMHAGFVNGSGILLAIFASLLVESNTLPLLFIIGGFTAILAQFTKLLQVNVKQKLCCSTIAQMGFMIMQCGLGFFNAAVVHLILHGFYKAYLFLSSGEEIQQTKPNNPIRLKIKPYQALVVLLVGGLGAYLFATSTGKGMSLNSGIFLTLIVAITVGQATYNIIKEQSLSFLQKTIIPPLLYVTGIGIYALMYKGVTILMFGMPMIDQPQPLSWIQIIFGIIFLLGFFIMKLGVYKIPWLYVKLMNLSQPNKKTVLMYKSKTI